MMRRGISQSDQGREGLRTERMPGKQKYGIRNIGNWDEWNESTLNSLVQQALLSLLDVLGCPFLF